MSTRSSKNWEYRDFAEEDELESSNKWKRGLGVKKNYSSDQTLNCAIR